MKHNQKYVLPFYLTPESREQYLRNLEAEKVHRNTLKENLKKRLKKAKSEGNQTLIIQLEAEWREMFYELSLPI
ncbi:MAG: hypothetical protein ACKO2V_16485 [Snowella sp.]